VQFYPLLQFGVQNRLALPPRCPGVGPGPPLIRDFRPSNSGDHPMVHSAGVGYLFRAQAPGSPGRVIGVAADVRTTREVLKESWAEVGGPLAREDRA
jgi:hypothetical protein